MVHSPGVNLRFDTSHSPVLTLARYVLLLSIAMPECPPHPDVWGHHE